MNYLGRASILSAREDCPIGLRIGYINVLSLEERAEVETTLNYWINATAIAGSTVEREYVWNNENDTVEIKTDFKRGHFKGNLLRHNTIEDGDNEFHIGLLRLFAVGDTPKTNKELIIPTSTPYTPHPFYIQFIYDDKIQEAERRIHAEYQWLSINTILADGKFIREITDTLNTIITTLNTKYESGQRILEEIIGPNY